MVASSVAVLVGGAVMLLFIWCGECASLCSKVAWSQNEAMKTSSKLASYIRNASAITGMDTNRGTWVRLRFPNGTTGQLIYTNGIANLRDGRLYLKWSNTTELIIARGLTEIMDDEGFTQPVFQKTRDNAIRISYRVSEPTAGGSRAADDEDFAAVVRISACLRNTAD
jgi:hypothetical protein